MLLQEVAGSKLKLFQRMNSETGKELFNLGHTFGHAIETATDYSEWLHGEAVGAGRLWLQIYPAWHVRSDDAVRIKALVREAGLPCAPPAFMEADTFQIDETG